MAFTPHRYAYLDKQREATRKLEEEDPSLEEVLSVRFKQFGLGQKNRLDWIYKHNIGKVWDDYLKGIKEFDT